MLRSVALLMSVLIAGCTHQLRIDNYPQSSFSEAPVKTRFTVGIVDSSGAQYSDRYITEVARALQRQPNVEQVLFPLTPSLRPDIVANIGVSPEYKGAGSNFWVNFPGFLIFAPAWNGYKYQANPRTRVNLTSPDGGEFGQFQWSHNYVFHQADIGRTWTEISWFEVGIIALIGGIVFTNYDEDQTPAFIRAAGASYGQQVAARISEALVNVELPEPAPAGDQREAPAEH